VSEVFVIHLWPPEMFCGVCDAPVFGLGGFGVPMWEGMVLPNDWPDEWGGFPACRPCYDWQQTLTKPAYYQPPPLPEPEETT